MGKCCRDLPFSSWNLKKWTSPKSFNLSLFSLSLSMNQDFVYWKKKYSSPQSFLVYWFMTNHWKCVKWLQARAWGLLPFSKEAILTDELCNARMEKHNNLLSMDAQKKFRFGYDVSENRNKQYYSSITIGPVWSCQTGWPAAVR